MERLIYDGKMSVDNSNCYMFITENIEDAEELFYDLYEDDIYSVAADYKSEDDKVCGIVISVELGKNNEVDCVLLSIAIEIDDEITEFEIAEIELDDDSVEILLNKIGV